jgi:hypothetical protein
MGGAAQGWIVAAGGFDLAFAAFHALFPVLFGWNQRLKKLDPINRGILRTLNVMVTLVLLGIGLLFCFGAATVASDPLGRGLLFAGAVFWAVRALIQGPMFGLQHPASVALAAVLAGGAIMHAVPAWP